MLHKEEVKLLSQVNQSKSNKPNQQTLIIHKLNTPQVTTQTFEGKEWYVIPTIAVQEQVLNGQLLPADEIASFPDSWNDVPLPVYHPQANGNPISAKNQEILANKVIGRWYNSKYDNSQLKGEIWIDKAKAELLAKNDTEVAAALDKIEKGVPMEVSTSYFCYVEDTSGTYNGTPYTGIQRNIVPDHIALLPNEIGACSIADGCGTMRVNHYKGGENLDGLNDNVQLTWKEKVHNTLNNLIELFKNDENDAQQAVNMTHRVLREKIRSLIKEKISDDQYYVWVVDIDTENWFVYEQEERKGGTIKYFKQSFGFDENNNVVLVGEPVEVTKKRVYEPVVKNQPAINNDSQNDDQSTGTDQTQNNEGKGEKQMADNKKKDLVTKIMKYDCNTMSQNQLEDMDESTLNALDTGFAQNCKNDEDDNAGNQQATNSDEKKNFTENLEAEVKVNAETLDKVLKDNVGLSLEDLKALKGNLDELKQNEETKKNKIIEALTANKKCEFTEDELKGFEINHLEKLSRLYKPAVYLGGGGPMDTNFEANADDGVPEYSGVLTDNSSEKDEE